jgi:GT2 family glycosyltransferase
MTSPTYPVSIAQQDSPLRPSGDELAISVIIPVYNGGPNFRKCLVSVKALLPCPLEVIVVGDGDTDGSSQLAQEFGVTVLRFPSPGGPARARNLGASRANGDILFFVDADVTVPQDVIHQVREVFARNSSVSAVIGSYDDQPAEHNFLSQYRNLLHHFVHQSGREEASTFWGACGVIRRDVFRTMGGFDERFTMPSIEDIELGHRLKQSGYSIRLVKSLQIKHWKRWNVRSMVRADFFQRALPWTDLIYRDRNLVNDLNVSFSGRASVLLTFGLLGSLLLSPWQPLLLIGAAVIGLVLLIVNLPFYQFLHRKRGFRFAVHAIPWHWFYFFYSGVAFAIGTARYFINRACGPNRPASPLSPRSDSGLQK